MSLFPRPRLQPVAVNDLAYSTALGVLIGSGVALLVGLYHWIMHHPGDGD